MPYRTLMILALMAVTMPSVAEPADSVVSIVAHWHKGDTLRYQYEQAQFKIHKGDTMCIDYTCEDMCFVVTDSTDRGYTIQYTPLSLETRATSDSAAHTFSKLVFGQLSNHPVILKTDRTGALQHIENWRELRDALRSGLHDMLDGNYAATGLDKLMPRNRLESLLNMQFADEESIRNSLEQLSLLFSMHGISAPVGRQELHESADYPTDGVITATYGPYGRHGYSNDYSLSISTDTNVPADDARAIADQVMDIVLADDLIGKVNHILGGDYGDMHISNAEEYHYFYNGWPCMVMRQQSISYGGMQNIKLRRAEWTHRAWSEKTGGRAASKEI